MKVKVIYIPFILTLIVSIFFNLTSCTKEERNITQLSKSTEESYNVEKTVANEKNTTDIENNTNGLDESNGSGIGGGIITVHKYRMAFNNIPQPFIEIIGEETYREWEKGKDFSVDSEEMAMLNFVRDFDISREDFDKANLKWAQIIENALDGKPCIFPKDYANQETDEIFNADLIYTFDEDQIKNYYIGVDYPYLYDFEFEEAVEAGEYTSRTEQWIDVDKMEADIIAKYGSID